MVFIFSSLKQKNDILDTSCRCWDCIFEIWTNVEIELKEIELYAYFL